MAKPNPRITLIGVYFGRLPFYASLFFKSVGANASIDFFLVTDRYPAVPIPRNARLLCINRTAFERLVSEKLGHSMRLHSPRKFCDYKPAYGRIFSDYLRGADYWGHIDFDIIWGNIPRFLYPATEAGNEVISADGNRISGPCTIYRNTARFRELFREIPDVIAKLNAPEPLDLDERDFDRVVKSSNASILMQCFYDRRDITYTELYNFLSAMEQDSENVLYRKILKAHPFTATTGRRLPAIWRDGELWNCLPCAKIGHVRLLNTLLLHLTTAKVSFTVDFGINLILPKLKVPARPAASPRFLPQGCSLYQRVSVLPREEERKPHP